MQGAARLTVWCVREKIIFFARLLLSLSLFVVIYPLHAARDQFGYGPETFDFDESKVEKWKEAEVNLPPYPKDQDLLAVPLSATDTIKVYIDRTSLSRGADHVARFSLVVESPSGARSVFYEGLRCETREYKTYAVGTPEQTFTPVKQAAWRPIPQPAMNAFRYHLYRDYLCDAHSSARPPAELVRLLTQ